MSWLDMFRHTESEPQVSQTSASRLLASSLTDPETRGEWRRKFKTGSMVFSSEYRNDSRDLSIHWSYAFSIYASSASLNTPFTLNEAEKKIVLAALKQFDERLRLEAEAAAIHRLTAPGIAIEAQGDETRSGSARRAKARVRKDIAQNTSTSPSPPGGR